MLPSSPPLPYCLGPVPLPHAATPRAAKTNASSMRNCPSGSPAAELELSLLKGVVAPQRCVPTT